MLGVEDADFSGQPFTEFLAPAEREKVLDRHRRRLEGEDLPSIYETVLLTRQGVELPVELHASVVVENGMTATLSIVRDISERRKIEEERKMLERQIQQSQKLESLGILAGGIAHDFNNLLMGILGNAGLALMELPPESPVRRTLERLETAAMRAAELTNQLLAYSGRGKFVVEPVSINTLIEEMINLLTAAVPKNVVLRLEQGSTVPLIDGDATQLRQVIMNLIINASEAIGDRSGVITLATGLTTVDKSYLAGTYMDEDLPEGVYTFLEVSDTGCGMDDKTKSRIFDPFFTTKFTGRGLGLAAVLGIVRGHHGTLKVYSEPGRGSTFKILFPAVGSDPALSRPREADADTRAPGGTILIVDDEETVRTVAKLALEKSGFRTLSARDGREAIDVFRRENGAVDVVLLDMTMPHLGGEETFRELRRIRPDVKVILSSGYNEYDAVNRFAGKGLAGFIQKPYRPVDLMAKVRSVISGRNGNGSTANAGGRP
jgi:PAS domain S-box-containing protein